MLAILLLIIQFVVTIGDPHWACEVTHRDPGVHGTYYLYCSTISPEGIELVQVGRFISDAHTSKATP